MKQADDMDWLALEKSRQTAREAKVRIALLQGYEQTRDELGPNGGYPRLFLGAVTGILILLYYVLRSDTNFPSQAQSFSEQSIGQLLLIIPGLLVVVPIVIVMFVSILVCISLYSYAAGAIASPILLFFYKILMATWIRIREVFIPLKHSNQAELEYFLGHGTWPAAQEMEKEASDQVSSASL